MERTPNRRPNRDEMEEDNMYPTGAIQKRFPSVEIPRTTIFRLAMDKKYIGCIIGMKGERISEMRKETGARIQFFTTGAVIVISAKHEPNMEEPPAVKALLSVVRCVLGKIKHMIPCSCRLLMLVPSSHMRLGFGGDMRSVERESGCKCNIKKVSKSKLVFGCDYKILGIQGDPKAVLTGMRIIGSQLKEFLVYKSVVQHVENKMKGIKASQITDQLAMLQDDDTSVDDDDDEC